MQAQGFNSSNVEWCVHFYFSHGFWYFLISHLVKILLFVTRVTVEVDFRFYLKFLKNQRDEFLNFGNKSGSDSLINQDSGSDLKNWVRVGLNILSSLTTLCRRANYKNLRFA